MYLHYLHCIYPSYWFLNMICYPTGRSEANLPGTFQKIHPAIKFTIEGNQENGTIPFLNTLVEPEADKSLSITVYRTPTHTYQYLQWDSHHNLAAKYSVISNLTHRAKTVCTGPEVLNKEIQYLRRALTKCKYPKWA